MRCPSAPPMTPPMAAPTTAPVRASPPTWLPMIAPTTAPTPAPRFAFALGSLGSVLVVAQAATKRRERRRVEALRIMAELYANLGRGAAQVGGLLRVRADVDLDAAVELAAVGRAVRRSRLRFAVADGVDARVAHAEVLEIARHRAGAALREALVVRVRADRVGVTRHFDRGVRVLLED